MYVPRQRGIQSATTNRLDHCPAATTLKQAAYDDRGGGASAPPHNGLVLSGGADRSGRSPRALAPRALGHQLTAPGRIGRVCSLALWRRVPRRNAPLLLQSRLHRRHPPIPRRRSAAAPQPSSWSDGGDKPSGRRCHSPWHDVARRGDQTRINVCADHRWNRTLDGGSGCRSKPSARNWSISRRWTRAGTAQVKE